MYYVLCSTIVRTTGYHSCSIFSIYQSFAYMLILTSDVTYCEQDAVVVKWTSLAEKTVDTQRLLGTQNNPLSVKKKNCVSFWIQRESLTLSSLSSLQTESGLCPLLSSHLHDKNCTFWISELIQCLTYNGVSLFPPLICHSGGQP